MNNGKKRFEIIYEKYYALMKSLGADPRDIHHTAMADFLGISRGKMQAWQRGQPPKLEDVASIATKLGFSYRWLVTGEGDPEGDDAPMVITPEAHPDPEKDAHIVELEAEIRTLQKELLDAKTELLALYKEQAGKKKNRT